MTERPSVSIRLGGSTYHVQSSASPDEVQRLADLVDERLRGLMPGDRPSSPQAFLLVALAFAHDLSDERKRREQAEGELLELRRRLASGATAAVVESSGSRPSRRSRG